MDKKLKQFIEQTKSINLSKNEKSAIKRSVLDFISQNPVRPDIQPRLSYGSNMFLTKLNFGSTMAILLIISVLVGGGVAVGAEKAMPGNILYPVKVNVNEEVRGWLAHSEEAKAGWEIRRTERRLEEAEELASEGSLDAKVSENIEANFEAHAERVKKRVKKFKNKDNFNAAASVSLNFETALKAHEKILSKLAKTKGGIEIQVKPIRAKIQSEARESVQERRRIDMEMRGETRGSVKVDNDDNKEDVEDKEDIELDMNTDTDLDIKLGL